MDNSLITQFKLNQDWISEKECVVFGVFEKEEIPCGLGFKKETAEKEAAKLFPVFSYIKKHIGTADFSGKYGEIAVVYPEGVLYKRIVLVGLGKKDDLDLEKTRMAASFAAQAAQKLNVEHVAFTLFGSPRHSAEDRLRALFDGIALTLYKFSAYKKDVSQEKEGKKKITDIEFVLPEIIGSEDVPRWEEHIKKYKTIAEAVYFARNIINQPANVVTPKFLAETAVALGKQYGVETTVFEKKELLEKGMNAIVAVGSGSDNEPRLITLHYKTKIEGAPTIALVGKGVCFDSGGISIKPSENMDEMKMDMAGAAAVMAACLTASRLALPLNVVAVIPAVENMPSSKSYRPGDIVKSASGKTIEVLNTDAEGRVILADALHYAVSTFQPTHLIDCATLTGAVVVALGHHYAAVLGNDKKLITRVIDAGARTGEKVWELPLDDVYKKQIESPIADVKNISGRPAGVITAALFLKEFIGDHLSWAHIDIAGAGMTPEAQGYKNKGGTGFGVRLLVEFLERLTTRA